MSVSVHAGVSVSVIGVSVGFRVSVVAGVSVNTIIGVSVSESVVDVSFEQLSVSAPLSVSALVSVSASLPDSTGVSVVTGVSVSLRAVPAVIGWRSVLRSS